MLPSAPGTRFTLNSNLLLLAAVLGCFMLNFYSKTMFFRPGSVHQWRQADCLSITKNYYEQGMDFFTPRIHYQGVEGGKAVSECPIMNYSVAALWKVFGEHEFIYRLLEYLLFITALFVLFNTALRFTHSPILALLTVSFPLTSPLLAYYAPNFLADVPAFSLGLCSFCLFYLFSHSRRAVYFYLSLALGTLAVLMKASALMALVIVYFFALSDLTGLHRYLRTGRIFEKGKVLPALALVLSAAVIAGWYIFAIEYNKGKTNNIFLLTVLPLWEMDEEDIIKNLKMLFNSHFPVFLNRAMFFLFICFVLYVISGFRRLSTFLRYSFVFCGLYFLAYLVFFFQVFSVHDYYLINLMIFPVVTLLCFAELIVNTRFFVVNLKFGRVFLFLSLLFNAFHCAAVYRVRTIEDDKLAYWFPFISEEESRLFKYLFWDYGNSIKKLEEIRPALREAGLRREDFVLSIPDQSFDISLYLMDQKGYTIARDHILHDSTVAERFVPMVKYVVLSDTTLKRTAGFRRMSHMLELHHRHKSVEIFRTKPGG